MISISQIKNSGVASRYFEGGDYYAKDDGGNEAKGTWSGAGAEKAGVGGGVVMGDFKDLLDGKLPSGDELGRGGKDGKEHVKGWDITFSAPKSVSVMALVAGDKRLVDAHEKAVKTALSYAEKNFIMTRVTEKGVTQHEKTGNAIFASFTHTTSRALDPQLHTHNALMNATQSGDGKWRSIDSKMFYKNSMAIASVYKMELGVLVRDLGYETEKGKHGNIEIKGVSKELMQSYSQRREEILKAKEEFGYTTAKGMDKAAVRTREAKQEVNSKDLVGGWEKTAGKELDTLKGLVAESQYKEISKAPESPTNLLTKIFDKKNEVSKDAVKSAIENLSERNATFNHTQLIQEVYRWVDGKVGVEAIERGIDQAVKSKALLRGEYNGITGYTSKEQLKTEQDLLRAIGKGMGKAEPLTSSWLVEAKILESDLNSEKSAALRMMALSPDKIIGVQGYAGVGKTYMLKAYKELADDTGKRILGFAPTTKAVGILAKDSGLETATAAKLVWNIRKGKTEEYKNVNTFVLDEGSLVGSKDMKEVVDFAAKEKIQLVMLGDRLQLEGVAAGKPFEQATNSGMDTAVMKEVMRQKNSPDLLAGVMAMIGGQPSKAFQYLERNIYESKSLDDRLNYIADKYINLTDDERKSHLVLIPDNKTRHEVNELIQQKRVEKGELNSESSATFLSLKSMGLTDKEKTDTRFYEKNSFVAFSMDHASGLSKDTLYKVGEVDKKSITLIDEAGNEIKWRPDQNKTFSKSAEVYEGKEIKIHENEVVKSTRTNKELGIRSGTEGTVEKIDLDNGIASIKDVNGRMHNIPLNEASTWDLSYASTVYLAQGATVKDVTLHLESNRINLTNLKTAYVGITRSSGDIDIVVDDTQKVSDALHQRSGSSISAMEMQGMDAKAEVEWGGKTLGEKAAHKIREFFGMDKDKGLDKQVESIELER